MTSGLARMSLPSQGSDSDPVWAGNRKISWGGAAVDTSEDCEAGRANAVLAASPKRASDPKESLICSYCACCC